MGDVKFWPAMEFDPNNGRARDRVSADFAADLAVGDRIVAVMITHESTGRTVGDSDYEIKMVDEGFAVFCRMTEIIPLKDHPGEFLVCAEYETDGEQH